MSLRPGWTCVAAFALSGALFAGDEPPASREVERARRELLEALGPASATNPRDAAEDAEADRAGADVLRLVDVRVRVMGVVGAPLAGVTVRALHETFDLLSAPAVTDASGRATLRLPRGAWRVDVGRADASGCVFAQTKLVAVPGEEARIDLTERRSIRFRRRSGANESPRHVTVAVPDFSFHLDCQRGDGAVEVVTTSGAALVVQAVDEPGSTPGFVLRRPVGAGATSIVVDEDTATRFTFTGAADREITPSIRSVDALAFDLTFQTDASRDVFVSGMPQAAVALSVKRKTLAYSFYALPLAVDGTARTFTGAPPFAASVGVRQNTFANYGARRNSLSVRAILRDANGLVLRGSSKSVDIEVDWEELLRGKVRASGTMKSWYYARTPPIHPAELLYLGYRLRVRAGGNEDFVAMAWHGQDEEVVAGKVHVKCYREFAPNVRLWAECVNDAVQAYEDTSLARRSRVDISLFSEMTPGENGWGGVRGNTGFAYLKESPVFGFTSTTYVDKTLFHELGHVQGYGHSTAARKRVMQQAGRRMSRRYAAIRPGPTRIPEGAAFLPVLEALTRGEIGPAADDEPADDEESAHDDGDDGDDPDVDIDTTGEDDFLTWYLRSTHGGPADRLRRGSGADWRWTLVLAGFTDDEIGAAILSRAAGEPLAWLSRLRGAAASERRVNEAVDASHGRIFRSADRSGVSSRWAKHDYAADADLAETQAKLLAEAGARDGRVAGLRAIAAQHLARGDRDKARAAFVEALAEARRGSRGLFADTLDVCAAAWSKR